MIIEIKRGDEKVMNKILRNKCNGKRFHVSEVEANNGDFKKHSFNRLYVFNTARSILRG